jgi:hypothetical protein
MSSAKFMRAGAKTHTHEIAILPVSLSTSKTTVMIEPSDISTLNLQKYDEQKNEDEDFHVKPPQCRRFQLLGWTAS